MAIDIYMELKGGPIQIIGETLDSTFKKQGAFELDSFEIGVKKRETEILSEKWNEMVAGELKERDFDCGRTISNRMDAIDMERYTAYTFSVKKQADASSPFLFKAYSMAIDKREFFFDKARITMRKITGSKPDNFIVYDFHKVYIKEYNLKISKGDENADPDEEITLGFGSWNMSYWVQQSESNRAGKMDNKPRISSHEFMTIKG